MKTFKLGRKKAHRTLLIRNLATSLVVHERIVTTASKAKFVQSYIERIISRTKKENDLNGYKTALTMLGGAEKPAKKVIEILKKNFANTQSGFTRIIKTVNRKGDNAPMAIIELTKKTEDLLKKTANNKDEKKAQDTPKEEKKKIVKKVENKK